MSYMCLFTLLENVTLSISKHMYGICQIMWSTLKFSKHWVKPLKIKNYALNKSKICLISF